MSREIGRINNPFGKSPTAKAANKFSINSKQESTRENVTKQLLDALDLQSDSQITDLKFTSEALSREIEQCVFSLFNNSQDKKYRDKIKKITTRLKGSRNQIVRNPLKRGTLIVEDFCNLDDKKLNEDSYFSKFNPNDNVDEKTNRSKLNIRPPPIKNLPMTSKLDLSSEAYVNDLTAYENNQTNNTEEVNDDNIKNLDAVISSISEEIKKDDDLDKIQTEVKEINNDEIEKEKENTPTGTLSNKVDEGRNLSSDKFNNETVEDKLNKGDLKNNLDDTDTAIENKKQSESKESGNVSHRTKDEQMFKPKNFVKFNPPVKKLASIVKENETHETIQDNNKTNLNQSYSMVSSNTEEKIEEEANLNKSFTSPCSTNNLKRLQEIIANKKREKFNLLNPPSKIIPNQENSNTKVPSANDINCSESSYKLNSEILDSQSLQGHIKETRNGDDLNESKANHIKDNDNKIKEDDLRFNENNIYTNNDTDCIQDSDKYKNEKENILPLSPKSEKESKVSQNHSTIKDIKEQPMMCNFIRQNKNQQTELMENVRQILQEKVNLELSLQIEKEKNFTLEKELSDCREMLKTLKLHSSKCIEENFQLEITKLKNTLNNKEREIKTLNNINSKHLVENKKLQEKLINIQQENEAFRKEVERRFISYSNEIENLKQTQKDRPFIQRFAAEIQDTIYGNQVDPLKLIQSTFHQRNMSFGNRRLEDIDDQMLEAIVESNNYNSISPKLGTRMNEKNNDSNTCTNGNPDEEVGNNNNLNMNGNTYDEMKDLRSDDNETYVPIDNNQIIDEPKLNLPSKNATTRLDSHDNEDKEKKINSFGNETQELLREQGLNKEVDMQASVASKPKEEIRPSCQLNAFDDDEIDKKTKEVNSAIKIFQETKTSSGDAFEDPESIFTEKNKLKNNNNNKPKLGGFKKISHKQTDSKKNELSNLFDNIEPDEDIFDKSGEKANSRIFDSLSTSQRNFEGKTNPFNDD